MSFTAGYTVALASGGKGLSLYYYMVAVTFPVIDLDFIGAPAVAAVLDSMR